MVDAHPFCCEALEDISVLSLPLPLVETFDFGNLADTHATKEVVSESGQNKQRRQWTFKEDQLLLHAICAVNILAECEQAMGKSSRASWSRIAQLVPGRLPRQCWDRFANHVNPTIDHSNFRSDEIEMVVRLHSLHGNQWARISDSLTRRTPMQIKNFVHSRAFESLVGRKAGRNTTAPSKANKGATAVDVAPTRKTPGIKFMSVKPGVSGRKFRNFNRTLHTNRRDDFCVDVRSVIDTKGVLRRTKFKKITDYLKRPKERGAAKRRTAAALLRHKVTSEPLHSLTPLPCVTEF